MNNLVCDICGELLPWLSITIAENCSVNGGDKDDVFFIHDSYLVVFGSENATTGWIIYDINGNEYDRILGKSIYYFTESGSYHVVPIY